MPRAMVILVVCVSGLVGFEIPAAMAVPIAIGNSSFELPVTPGPPNDFFTFRPPSTELIPDWDAAGGDALGIINEVFLNTPLTPAGDQWLFINSTDDPSQGATVGSSFIWQNIGTVVTNADYTFDYLLGYRDFLDFASLDALRISIWAGGNTPFAADGAVLLDVAEATLPASIVSTQANTTILLTGGGNGGQTLWLRYEADGPDSGFGQVLIDDVRGAVVPEPSTLILVCMGLVALAARRRPGLR